MSGPDPGVTAVALACCYSLWWCLSLARRLRRIERTSKTDQLTGLGSGDWLDTERWPDGWTDTPDKLAAPPAEETVAHKMPTETGEVYGERRKGGWPKGVSRSDMAKR